MEQGERIWTWRPAGLKPGVYFVRATIGDRQESRRLVWLAGGAN
jgi:hypothetical protein